MAGWHILCSGLKQQPAEQTKAGANMTKLNFEEFAKHQ
jgi:hypothetical protein